MGHIEVGIPQCSFLGPILLFIYTYDLPQTVWGSTVSIHADDARLCHKSNDITWHNKAVATNSVLVTTKQNCNIKDANLNLEPWT